MNKVIIALLLAFVPAAAFAWPAHVVYVTDGDTLRVVRVKTGERVDIRLAGIDAPEVSHGPKRPGQPFGDNAKRYFKHLLSEDPGVIWIQPNGTMSYDRVVARISLKKPGTAKKHKQKQSQDTSIWGALKDKFNDVKDKLIPDAIHGQAPPEVSATDVGMIMIRAGMAWNDSWYSPDYGEVEDKAQVYNAGLWQRENPIPPWVWRDSHWPE